MHPLRLKGWVRPTLLWAKKPAALAPSWAAPWVHTPPPTTERKCKEIRAQHHSPLLPDLAGSCPRSAALPFPKGRRSRQPGLQQGCLQLLIHPHAANCRFPGMTDVAAIQCFQAKTKASPITQSQQGTANRTTSIGTTCCHGPFSATRPRHGMHLAQPCVD